MSRSLTLRRALAVLPVLAAALVAPGPASPAVASAPETTATAPAADGPLAAKPYMGWSSWSMQSSNHPGLNPKGMGSWLTEANLLKQADAVASRLKASGYTYVNMDAGWWMNWDWVPDFDTNGRPKTNPERFPHGIEHVADQIHRKGLKSGIYLPVGLEKVNYDKGDFPIAGAPACSTHDIVHDDLRTTNGWDSSYKLDFAKPCAQKYVDSIATMFAGWGIDFFKLDGVGPGSGRAGADYDNRDEVAAYRKALDATGRKIHFEVSWSLDIAAIDTWKAHTNGWRIDTDVECYCDTLVTWENSVDNRWADLPQWVRHAGPGGWNDLDSLDVGNGRMDGITPDERRSYMTLWSIAAAPLYTGDDVTKLDELGEQLLTNPEVLAVNQQGRPAKPVEEGVDQQTWWVENTDGSFTVALFNLASTPKAVQGRWSDLGLSGAGRVRDLWARKDIGTFGGGYGAVLPPHGSRLFKVTPAQRSGGIEAESGRIGGRAAVRDCAGCSGGRKVGDLYQGGSVEFRDVRVPRAGTYRLAASYLSGDPRWFGVTVNDAPAVWAEFPATADWNTAAAHELVVNLKAGTNTVVFDSGAGYAPDLDRIDISPV
ncbi:glycoside hydrolase family 27 protein [Umezawaea sp. Da 62-37]|uniref:alpha-galactosidase D n=1 Tax=Umezawaea sp. Da 62-37 TaxID=3075927 RepID=UPI0028F735C5|nr:glycoside hydrolase family 27 protein [Umezawaea sp. Da 62-37]WNV84265.1 glycoside hydrolase family 27 protein [Umezawaea sp. Da 62-37]